VEARVMRGTTPVNAKRSVNAKRIVQVAASLILLGLGFAAPAGCSQPPVRCTAELGEGIARFTVDRAKLKAIPPACQTDPTKAPFDSLPCVASTPDNIKSGICVSNPDPSSASGGGVYSQGSMFAIGVESYVPNPMDPNAPSEPTAMAIKAEWTGERIQGYLNNFTDLPNYPYTGTPPAPPPTGTGTNYPYAFGKFDSVYPDSSGMCAVSSIANSSMTYPEVPSYSDANGKPTPDLPSTKVTYAWSNVRVYVAASSLGVQTYANLTITQDACSIPYIVSILVPRVGCASAADSTQPDPKLCDPNPDGPHNPSGSGISEDVTPSCENIGTMDYPDFECLPPTAASDPNTGSL
jgi:hypothetical protein